jgi:hypothetical protein
MTDMYNVERREESRAYVLRTFTPFRVTEAKIEEED